MMNKD